MSAIESQAYSDEQLARSLATGDAAAFDELYRRYQRPLSAYAARMLGDQSAGEDVAQITLLNAYQALRRGSEPLYVRAWLYRIAQNAAIEILSRRHELVAFSDEHDRGQDLQEASAVRGALLAALGALPERQRRAYLLREVQGLRVREIGEALSLTTEQVEQALFAARNRLAEHLTFGDQLNCATVRELHGGELRRTEQRAIKRHMRSCGACRADTPRSRLRIGVFGPLTFLRDLAGWLAGGTGIAASAKVGAMAAVAVVAVGTPVLGGDASSPAVAAARPAPALIIPPATPATDKEPVVRAPRKASSVPPDRTGAPPRVAGIASEEPSAPAPVEPVAEPPVPVEAQQEAPPTEEPVVEEPVVEEPVAQDLAEEPVAEEGYGESGTDLAQPIEEVPADENGAGELVPGEFEGGDEEPGGEEPGGEEPGGEEPGGEEPGGDEPETPAFGPVETDLTQVGPEPESVATNESDATISE